MLVEKQMDRQINKQTDKQRAYGRMDRQDRLIDGPSDKQTNSSHTEWRVGRTDEWKYRQTDKCETYKQTVSY